MPNIDFNEFQKQEEEPGEERTISVSRLRLEDTQYFIKEEDILFDILDLDLGGEGPGMEIYMSFLGGDFKMKCSCIPKKEFDTLDLPSYLMGLIEEYKPCLLCKTKFLGDFCDGEEGGEEDSTIEFIPDDDEEA